MIGREASVHALRPSCKHRRDSGLQPFKNMIQIRGGPVNRHCPSRFLWVRPGYGRTAPATCHLDRSAAERRDPAMEETRVATSGPRLAQACSWPCSRESCVTRRKHLGRGRISPFRAGYAAPPVEMTTMRWPGPPSLRSRCHSPAGTKCIACINFAGLVSHGRCRRVACVPQSCHAR